MKAPRFFLGAVFFLFWLACFQVEAEEPERWINFFDGGKGLWAKRSTLTGETFYLYRYGSSRDQVSFLSEKEIQAVQAQKLLTEILAHEIRGKDRGFGDSVFRVAATVQDVRRLVEEAGWRKTDYRDGTLVYRKEGVETPLLLPAEGKKTLTSDEFRKFLLEAGVSLSVPHPVSPKY